MLKVNPFSMQSEKIHHSLVFINPAMLNRVPLFLYLYHHTKPKQVSALSLTACKSAGKLSDTQTILP